jgi:hypothetical protein
MESAIVEKFRTMVKLWILNSRIKGFYDIWLFSRTSKTLCEITAPQLGCLPLPTILFLRRSEVKNRLATIPRPIWGIRSIDMKRKQKPVFVGAEKYFLLTPDL